MVLSSLTCPLTVEGDTLGSQLTMKLPTGGRTLGVRYRCGSQSGTVVGKTTEQVFSWTPAVELAAEYPDRQRIPVTLTLEIYRGLDVVETRQEQLLLKLPEDLLPEITVEIGDAGPGMAQCGSLVQGVSRAAVEVTAKGTAGAEIKTCAVTCGGLTGTGLRTVFDLPQAGNLTVTVQVTDSRGRSARCSRVIPVLPRKRPWGQILSAVPCDASGGEDPQGAYRKAAVRGEAMAFGENEGRFAIRCLDGQGQTQTVDLGIEPLLDKTVVLPGEGEWVLIAADAFETLEFPYRPHPLLDVSPEARAIGIGCRGDRTGSVSLGLPLYMGGNALSGLPRASDGTDALPLGQAEGRFFSLTPLWENPNPDQAFEAQNIPAAGSLLLIEARAALGGGTVWTLAGDSGSIQVCMAGQTAVRPVTQENGTLHFENADRGNDWAVPLRVFRLLP